MNPNLLLLDFFNRSSISKKLSFFQESDSWTPGKREKYQDKQFCNLITHVYKNVPYYRNLMIKLNLGPDDFNSVKDSFKLPIVTKEIIKKNRKLFYSKDITRKDLIKRTTGGSTGEPLEFFITKDTWSWIKAALYFSFRWANFEFGDKMVTIGGPSIANRSKFLSKKFFFEKFIENNLKLSAFNLDEITMKSYVQSILKFKPKAIRGYANALYLFSNFILKKNISFSGIKCIFSTAEKLDDAKRKTIEKAFNCKVYNQYGAFDGGLVSADCCDSSGLHIFSEICLVDIIKNDSISRNNSGKVIVTNLKEYGFPLIRYELGDLAEINSTYSSCSNKRLRFKDVIGRDHDFLVDKKGKLIHGEFFSHIIRSHYVSIDFFSVAQKKDYSIIFTYVPLSNEEYDFSLLVNEVRRKFGENIIFSIKKVKSLTTSKSGKHKYIYSDIFMNSKK